jgi:flagellar protein FlaI
MVHGGEVLEKYNDVVVISKKDREFPLYVVKSLALTPDESRETENLVKLLREKVPLESSLTEREESLYVKEIQGHLKSKAINIPDEGIERISKHVLYSLTGLGKLQFLLNDDHLEEIMVIGVDKPVYVFHRKFGMCETNLVFKKPEETRWLVDRISMLTGRRIDFSLPLLDAALPDGSRVNATMPPISVDGPTITIRKFRREPLTIVDLLNYKTITPELAAFLWMCIEGLDSPPNILVAGGAGSGKTALLNVLCSFIPSIERIVVIEDTLELFLPLPHVVRLETRPPNIEGKGEITADTLLKNVLRMRPDRIIMGEIRGIEARTLFNAMNTGHKGVTGTIHANTAPEVISRVENPPMDVPRNMLTSLDLIILIEAFRKKRGILRRITDVSEVRYAGEEAVKLNKLYRWDPELDTCRSTNIPGRLEMGLAESLRLRGLEYQEELERREKVLRWMQGHGIERMEEVLKVIREYRTGHESLMEKIEKTSF